MEQITPINANRILWMCQEYGIDVAQRAAEVQIAESTLAQVVASARGLTYNQLQKLAKYFNKGVLFFLEPGDPQQEQIFTAQFRTLANQNPHMTPKVKAIIQRAENQRAIYLGLLEDLGEEPTAFAPPALVENMVVQDASAAARAWLGLTGKNTFEDYRRAVEAKGVLVFLTNGHQGDWQIPKSEDIEGFCLYNPLYPIIVVKKQEAPARQVFTLFHELGHLLLHRDSFVDANAQMQSQSGNEFQANSFAGHLLVPDAALESIDRDNRPFNVDQFDDWLRQPRTDLTVSTETILRRLLDTGRLTREEYEEYRQWNSQRVYPAKSGGSRTFRHREPIHIFGDRYSRTVIDALYQKRITSCAASRFLDNIHLSDLRRLEAYCVAS